MPNSTASTDISEAGFIGMSHYADALEPHAGDSGSDQPTGDGPVNASELQALLVDEIRARPLRALGWAAVAGLAVGIWVAR